MTNKDRCQAALLHAQWIGEDAALAERAYAQGNTDMLKACLDAIQCYARELGYVPAPPQEEQ